MKKNRKQKITLAAISLVLGTALLMIMVALATAVMPSAARLNNRGNDQYARQAYEEALVAYQKAQIDRPVLAEPYYNAANALYRRGAYAEALEQLQVALSFADETDLAEKSFFNLGNNLFNQEQMEAAVSAFREALLRNPADDDAKYNLELALQIQEQQEQEQQQDPENSEQDAADSEDSNSENSENSENQEDQPSEGDGQQEEDQQEQGQGDEQSEKTGQESDSGSDNQESEPEEAAAAGAVDGELTTEQAQQLLNAIAAEAQTLQEALGKIISGPANPPAQDW